MSGWVWLSPGRPDQRTGGFLYNARMVHELGAAGVNCRVLPLDGDWPLPEHPSHAGVFGTIEDGWSVIADGLLWTGLNSIERQALCARCRVWVVIHSPLDKEGVGDEQLARREAQAVSEAHGWWATSAKTAQLMASRMGADQTNFVIPGTEAVTLGPPGSLQHFLAVGHLIRRKNYRFLLEALGECLDLEWTLEIVGSTTKDPSTAQDLSCLVAALGLEQRVRFLGELDGPALSAAYQSAGLLLHTAEYEAYGMVLTEALAHGVPIMSRPAGALDGLDSAAVLRLSANAQQGEWAGQLRAWLSDTPRADKAATAARGMCFPSWAEQAAKLAVILGL